MKDLVAYRDFGVALAAGLLIGAERGWTSRNDEARKRVARVHAFALVAVMAMAVRWAQLEFGDAGAAVPILIAEAFDIDAATGTLGGLPWATIGAALAGLVLAAAVFAKMAFKLLMVIAFAGWTTGREAIHLLAASALCMAVFRTIQPVRPGSHL